MNLIEIKWTNGNEVEYRSFGGNASIEQLLYRAEEYFKDRDGEGEAILAIEDYE